MENDNLMKKIFINMMALNQGLLIIKNYLIGSLMAQYSFSLSILQFKVYFYFCKVNF